LRDNKQVSVFFFASIIKFLRSFQLRPWKKNSQLISHTNAFFVVVVVAMTHQHLKRFVHIVRRRMKIYAI
jgi:hypothetical protein